MVSPPVLRALVQHLCLLSSVLASICGPHRPRCSWQGRHTLLSRPATDR